MVEKPNPPGEPSPRVNGWLSLVVFAVLCFLAFFVWQSQKAHETEDLAAEVALASDTLAARIDADLKGRLASLRRMADRWAIRGGTPEREFLLDAAAYITDQPGFQALEWVDADFFVRLIVPLEGNEGAIGRDMGSEVQRRAALEEAQADRRAVATAPVDLVQGGKGFLVCLPIYSNDVFDGFIVAVFRMQEWLDYVLSGGGRLSVDDFNISVSFDGVPVYIAGSVWTGTAGSEFSTATSETSILDRGR